MALAVAEIAHEATFLLIASATASGAADIPKFETVSIKRASFFTLWEFNVGIDGELVKLNHASVNDLIAVAFHIESSRIAGPSWMNSTYYDITAKAGKKLEYGEMYRMLGPLLEERFGLKMHREKRQVEAFDLVMVSKGKLPPPSPGNWMEGDPDWVQSLLKKGRSQMFSCGMIVMTGFGYPGRQGPDKFARWTIGTAVGRKVVDKTGYAQPFDIDIRSRFRRVPDDQCRRGK